jgi:hypothetical protein
VAYHQYLETPKKPKEELLPNMNQVLTVNNLRPIKSEHFQIIANNERVKYFRENLGFDFRPSTHTPHTSHQRIKMELANLLKEDSALLEE